MAGRGSRLRPHTLTTPKPLIRVAGTPIVSQLIYEIVKAVDDPITDIGFIIGNPAFFGVDVVTYLKELAKELGAKPHIFRQDHPLGTGHAIMCAERLLSGPAIIAYPDTLIRSKLKLDPKADAVIWVKRVSRPEAFGVVALDKKRRIINLVEKPKEFVSDLAVIGIYYFKNSEELKKALKKVVAQDLLPGEEYQINHGIHTMIKSGSVFKTGEVQVWMDCGNPEVTLGTNSEMLEIKKAEGENLQHSSAELNNSIIIPPCFIGENVKIKNSTIGPGVSIGERTQIDNCQLKNCLIQNDSYLENLTLEKAMIGNQVHYKGNSTFVSIGDYSHLQ